MTWENKVAAAKEAVVEAARLLASSGMLFRGSHANLSARLDERRFVMTRGGSVAALDVTGFAILDVDGTVLEGEMDPTNQEVIAMHAGLYRIRPAAGAVIHTHAPHLTTFAVAQEPVPLVYEPVLRFGITEPIPVVPWAPRGSERSVGGILETAETHPGVSAVLLANHGVLVWAEDPDRACHLLINLDEMAELALMARALGGAKPLPDRAVEAVRERMAAFGSRH
ncbi:MAG: class II aldolase/adducin family protein [Firmicutes bacterium]|nr:class II aldolase/adducin family protein [Alicyclobacillaceae bacterium]MCL6496092.1 class II aldolase/adducin family protein [Bacillota bacterium]